MRYEKEERYNVRWERCSMRRERCRTRDEKGEKEARRAIEERLWLEVSRAKGNLLMIVPAEFNEKEMKIGDGGGDECGGEREQQDQGTII